MSGIESANIFLPAGNELIVSVPFETKRCFASLRVLSVSSGMEPRVDVLGAPVLVDVSYNLLPGAVFLVFAWTNASIRIEGTKQLLSNCYRSSTPSFLRPLVEYHCIIHDARLNADKNGLFGPIVLVCGRNNAEKHAIARILCSYGARTGWSPQLVDLDCGIGQMLGAPGTVCAGVIEYPMTVDEDVTTGPLSVCFFTGSTEPQTKTSVGEWNMFGPYTHYSYLLLSCVSERITRHQGGVIGSSGAVVVLPDLEGVSGLVFVENMLSRFNISHVLCVGDDFFFSGIYDRVARTKGPGNMRSDLSVRVDKVSPSFHYPQLCSGTERLSLKMERYFFGDGAVELQPSEIIMRFSAIEIFLLKDRDGHAVVSAVEQDALEGIVGCVGAVVESSLRRDKDVLSLAPFALARVQSVDANGVTLLVSTHSALSEKLTLVVGSFRWLIH